MSFTNVKGQDRVIYLLKRELKEGRVASSYLFFGPDGVGKDITALTLAKALNCFSENSDSCDKCASCVKIENGNHPDVLLFDRNEKGSIVIEAVRDFQDKINLKPYEGRFKIFIIKNSDSMTEEAANCLLKTLEEPPKNSIIVLITSRPEAIIPTVKSRCRQVKFAALQLDIKAGLARERGFDKAQALFLARLANSGIVISMDDESKNHDIFSYKNKILDEFNSDEALLDEKSFIFSESREDMKIAASILEAWFRDILVTKLSDDTSLIFNSDRLDEIKKMQGKFSFERLERILGCIEDTRYAIERNVGPKMALNDLKMKMAELRIKE